MNYPESQQILGEIKKAKKILINCHRGPDPDSIGSALSLKIVLEAMNKVVDVVCVSDELYENVNYLKHYSDIKRKVDFNKLDLSQYELFISPDSSSVDQITDVNDFGFKNINLVTIDHHKSNTGFGNINLIDSNITSVGELLFRVYTDWGVEITTDTANCLMAAMVGDTGAFRYPGVGVSTYKTVIALIEKGADKDFAVNKLYGSEPFELIKFYGDVLSRVKIDRDYQFVYAAVPYEAFEAAGKPNNAKESAASLFCQVVKDTNFGFIAIEKESGKLSISFRSRTGFDTSKIAVYLGGGGHAYASGASITELSFDKAVEKVLEACRKYATKS